jgi:hypothetical protein
MKYISVFLAGLTLTFSISAGSQAVTLKYLVNPVGPPSVDNAVTEAVPSVKGVPVKKKQDEVELFREIVNNAVKESGKVVWDFTDYPSKKFKRELFLSGINVVYLDVVPDRVTIQYEGVSIVKGLQLAFPNCNVRQKDSNTYIVKCLVTKMFHLPLVFTESEFNISSGDSINTESGASESSSSGSSGSDSGDFKVYKKFSYYSLLEKQIRKFLSKDGSYSISHAAGFISVTDHKLNIERVSDFLNSEFSLTKNVKFKVRLLRVELNDGYDYGIDWNKIISNGLFKNLNISISGTTSVANPVVSITGGQENMLMAIKAIQNYGKVEKIHDWEEISKGGEPVILREVTVYPYISSVSTSQTDTSTLTTPEFKEISIGLKITINHIISEDDIITLNGVVDTSTLIEFKQFQVMGTNVERPVYTRDFIKFQASIPIGRTIIISGIKLKTEEAKNDTVPLVSQLPVLDWLFGHKKKSRGNVEYLVVVTPEYTSF